MSLVLNKKITNFTSRKKDLETRYRGLREKIQDVDDDGQLEMYYNMLLRLDEIVFQAHCEKTKIDVSKMATDKEKELISKIEELHNKLERMIPIPDLIAEVPELAIIRRQISESAVEAGKIHYQIIINENKRRSAKGGTPNAKKAKVEISTVNWLDTEKWDREHVKCLFEGSKIGNTTSERIEAVQTKFAKELGVSISSQVVQYFFLHYGIREVEVDAIVLNETFDEAYLANNDMSISKKQDAIRSYLKHKIHYNISKNDCFRGIRFRDLLMKIYGTTKEPISNYEGYFAGIKTPFMKENEQQMQSKNCKSSSSILKGDKRKSNSPSLDKNISKKSTIVKPVVKIQSFPNTTISTSKEYNTQLDDSLSSTVKETSIIIHQESFSSHKVENLNDSNLSTKIGINEEVSNKNNKSTMKPLKSSTRKTKEEILQSSTHSPDSSIHRSNISQSEMTKLSTSKQSLHQIDFPHVDTKKLSISKPLNNSTSTPVRIPPIQVNSKSNNSYSNILRLPSLQISSLTSSDGLKESQAQDLMQPLSHTGIFPNSLPQSRQSSVDNIRALSNTLLQPSNGSISYTQASQNTPAQISKVNSIESQRQTQSSVKSTSLNPPQITEQFPIKYSVKPSIQINNINPIAQQFLPTSTAESLPINSSQTLIPNKPSQNVIQSESTKSNPTESIPSNLTYIAPPLSSVPVNTSVNNRKMSISEITSQELAKRKQNKNVTFERLIRQIISTEKSDEYYQRQFENLNYSSYWSFHLNKLITTTVDFLAGDQRMDKESLEIGRMHLVDLIITRIKRDFKMNIKSELIKNRLITMMEHNVFSSKGCDLINEYIA